MNKISKLRKTLLVFAIISFALIAVFATLFILEPFFLANYDGAVIGPSLDFRFKLVSQSFVLPFNQAQAGELIGAYIGLGESIPLTLSIIVYVLSGVMLILLVLAIVFVNSKRKPLFTLYALAVLAATYIGYTMITYGFIYIAGAKAFFDPTLAPNVWFGILECVVFALGCLAFVSVIVTSILGVVYAAKAAKAELAEEPAPASVAELAGDPEAVQEGDELLAPAEAPLIESEPEPVPEEIAEEEPVPEEEVAVEEEPVEEVPAVEEEPAEEPTENHQRVEVNVNNTAPQAANAQGIDQASLASLLREVVRDIVRDEIARNNLNQPQQQSQPAQGGTQTITGATFGGPLVVQYFNGGINGVSTPVSESKTVEKVVEVRNEEPKPAPTPVEEKKEEPKPAPRPLFVKKEAVEEPKPAPAVEAAPAPVEEPKKYERLTFAERLLQSEKDVHELYNEVKNEILSYGVKSRISAVGDTFRLHKKMYVRITVAGKSLKLYFALNPADYANSTLPIQDASDKDMYQEIPLVFKVKSPLSVRRCKELIQDVMEKDGLEQGEVGKVNWIKELKAEMANGKKPEKED